MKMSRGFTGALMLGIGVGVGCGYLAFDPGVRAHVNRGWRRGSKLFKRQTAEARQSARLLLQKGEKEIKHAAEVGRRVYHEVTG